MSKVLVLTNAIGGLYQFRYELIERLIHDKYQVFISAPNGSRMSDFENMGCQCIATDISRRGLNPIIDAKLFMKYIRILKTCKPDVVLTYTIKPNVYGGMVSSLAGVPYIVNITGLGSAIENPGILKNIMLTLYKLSMKKAKCLFFQNKSNMDLFREKGIIHSNAFLIPGSGVNLIYHRPIPYPKEDKGVTFLFIGRMIRDKGINELLSAIEVIKAKKPNTQFHLIGRYDGKHKELLEEAERNGFIICHGRQPDVRSFIGNSHCTVLPSYHEGISNVLLESAATGRPVIATDVPGCKETFDEGLSGFGCKPRDVKSLVDAMLRFIELPWEEKRQMGVAGRKKVEQEFDRNFVTDAYLREIEKI